MDERDILLVKKNELEQMIQNKQESLSVSSNQWINGLSAYASHPADMASHLQALNIELERINDELAQYNPGQLS
ncbi:MAG: hypothetical protein CVU90_13070 [Firmicutes bacterium HGW-Firmicutes-15]|nr:MAG: hypothetical protein CVU90_13070 [Firmicutes bacterium HGW-Firmicutes-15]